MTKRIKNLTIGKMTNFCKKTECRKCHLHTERGSAVIPGYMTIGCPFDFFFKNIEDHTLEREVEIDE